MIKSTKFELKLGFSPKNEFRWIFQTNSNLSKRRPWIRSKTLQQPFSQRKTNQNDPQIRFRELSKRVILRGEKGGKGGRNQNQKLQAHK